MTPILYVTTFGMVLVLFASAIAVVVWAVKQFVRTFAGSAEQEQKRRGAPVRDQWNPAHPLHYKRAGQ